MVATQKMKAATPTGREPSLTQRLISNTLFNFVAQLYTAVLGLAVTPYVVHRLGTELYGVLAIVAAIGLGGSFSLGLGRALAKYVAEFGTREGSERIRSLVQTALAVTLPGAIGGCLLIVGFRRPIAEAFFHGHALRPSNVTFALLLAGLGFGVSLLSDCFSGLLVGLQRFDIYNGMNIVLSTVRNLGAVLVLALGLFARAVLLVYLFAGIVALCGYAYFGRKLIAHLSLRPKFYWPEFKLLFSFAASVVVVAIGVLLIHRLDRVMLAYYLPISAVAFYVIPYSLAERTGMGVSNITWVVFPSSSELSSVASRKRLRSLYVRASKMAVLVGLPVAIILIVFPSEILRFWVGASFAAQGSLVLRILALGFLVNVLGYVPFVVAQGIGRPWTTTFFVILNSVLTLGFILVLIPRYGILGASAGFALAQWVASPPFIWKVNRMVGVSWQTLIVHGYSRAFACGGAAFALLWLLRPLASSLLSLVLWCLVALGLYSLLVWALAIRRDERAAIFERITYMLRLGGQPSGA
jgi:O-antigen/teichoic acid export membrane protein